MGKKIKAIHGSIAGLHLHLFYCSGDDIGVRVALVHRRVRAQKVEIPFSFGVPNMDTLCAAEDNWQRVVVVGAIRLLSFDEL